MFLCRNVLQQHDSPLHKISLMVILDVDMLGPIMINWILIEFDATLIVIVKHYRIHSLNK